MKTIKFSKPKEASMPKKTIKVDQLVLRANFQLIRTDNHEGIYPIVMIRVIIP